MRIVHNHAKVRVPATSGNCGPGFDSIGMALDIWDEVSATLTTGSTRVSIVGEGSKELPRDDRHLIIRVMREMMDKLGLPQTGIELVCRNSIQQGKGLGSSAAATVAGLMLVAGLTGSCDPMPPQGALTKEKILDIATEYEGHPDNAAPCIYGGATLSWMRDMPDSLNTSDAVQPSTTVKTVSLHVHPSVRVSVLIPAETLPTVQARAVLPASVAHHDAAYQAARSALLVYALEHDPALLFDATEERLHQSYRAASMPHSAALLAGLRESGWPAVVAGAGPSLLLFSPVDSALAQIVTKHGFQIVDSQQVRGAYFVND